MGGIGHYLSPEGKGGGIFVVARNNQFYDPTLKYSYDNPPPLASLAVNWRSISPYSTPPNHRILLATIHPPPFFSTENHVTPPKPSHLPPPPRQ